MMRRLNSERGTAIIMAIVLMTMMVGVGLAAYSFVDQQQVETTRERQRESSFNLAEAALNSQSFVLSRRWAGAPTAYATTTPTCSNAGGATIQCPDPAQLTTAYNSADYKTGTTWSTTVYDDTSGPFYDSAVVEAKNAAGADLTAHWDANGNRRVWVKASTTVRDRIRTLVALVQVQEQVEFLPKRVILAGQFELTPNGNGVYIQTNPDATSQHPVSLRCSIATTGCAEFTPDKKNPQLDPPGAILGNEFVGKDAIEDDVKDRLKERAIADGTFYNNVCPTDAQLTGKVVWVQGCALGKYTKNNIWNAQGNSGILIWADGVLELGGKSDFWGIVYHLNNQNSSDNELLRLRGGLTIHGGAFVDGPGGIDVGSNRVNLTYDEGAFIGISSYGTAAIVQNSWRDITGG
jgi:Tfp pilus assembly protein PilX